MKGYIALFESIKDKDRFSVVFPDFPGCISAGDTYEEAVAMAHEALSAHIALMKEDGDKIPNPRTLKQIKETWQDWKEWKNNYNFLIGSHICL